MNEENVCEAGESCSDNSACCEVLLYPKLLDGIEKKDGSAYDVSQLLKMALVDFKDLGIKEALKILSIVTSWVGAKSFDLSSLKDELKSVLPEIAESAAKALYDLVTKWLRNAAKISDNMVDNYVWSIFDLTDLNAQILAYLDKLDGIQG